MGKELEEMEEGERGSFSLKEKKKRETKLD